MPLKPIPIDRSRYQQVALRKDNDMIIEERKDEDSVEAYQGRPTVRNDAQQTLINIEESPADSYRLRAEPLPQEPP